MSDKKTGKEEIAKLKLKKECADDFAQDFCKQSDVLQGEIEILEKSLADEEKPELRHGDYGFADGCPRMTAKYDDDVRHYGETGNHTGAINNLPIKVVLGNIFDDLKALQEDVTEFEVNCDTVKADRVSVEIQGGEVRIVSVERDQRSNIYMSSSKFDGFLKKGRVLLATLKRKEAKK